jgi:hypothetical protein
MIWGLEDSRDDAIFRTRLLTVGLLSNEPMLTVKQEAASLIERLPDDCSVEDIQYHLYVLEKVRRGLERADTEGVIEQDEAEARLAKWIIE